METLQQTSNSSPSASPCSKPSVSPLVSGGMSLALARLLFLNVGLWSPTNGEVLRS